MLAKPGRGACQTPEHPRTPTYTHAHPRTPTCTHVHPHTPTYTHPARPKGTVLISQSLGPARRRRAGKNLRMFLSNWQKQTNQGETSSSACENNHAHPPLESGLSRLSQPAKVRKAHELSPLRLLSQGGYKGLLCVPGSPRTTNTDTLPAAPKPLASNLLSAWQIIFLKNLSQKRH